MTAVVRFPRAACLMLAIVATSVEVSAQLSDAQQAVVDATAFLETGDSSGTGFLVEHASGSPFMITCAHVVAGVTNDLVRAVFASGTSSPQPCDAVVVAVDAKRDLAVLSLQSRPNPSPIKLPSSVTPRVMEWIGIAGFPLGHTFARGGDYPAVALSRGVVTSIRAATAQAISIIQVDADIHPGNSGGPVFDASGRVIGVAAAKLGGTKMGFAIDISEAETLFEGRFADSRIQMATQDVGSVTYRCVVEAIDPLRQIANPVLLVRMRGQEESTIIPLDRSGRYLEGHFTLARGVNPEGTYDFSVSAKLHGRSMSSATGTFAVAYRSDEGDDWLRPKTSASDDSKLTSLKLLSRSGSADTLHVSVFALPEGARVGAPIPLPNFESVLLPLAPGRLLVVDARTGEVRADREDGAGLPQPVLTLEGILLPRTGGRGELRLLDTSTLETKKTYEVRDVRALVGNEYSAYVAVQDTFDRLYRLDLRTSEQTPSAELSRLSLQDPAPIFHEGTPARPDGIVGGGMSRYFPMLACASAQNVFVFVMGDSGPTLTQVSANFSPGAGSLRVSDAGGFVGVRSWIGYLFSPALEAAGFRKRSVFVYSMDDLRLPKYMFDDARFIRFSNSDRCVVLCDEKGIRRHDLSLERVETFPAEEFVADLTSFEMLPDSETAVGCSPRELRVFKLPPVDR